jgi:hypothetical protein
MADKTFTIGFDSDLLTRIPNFLTWLRGIGAEIEEGHIALVSLPHTTQIRRITPHKFRVFEPGVDGTLIVDLTLNIYEMGITFERGNDAAASKPE